MPTAPQTDLRIRYAGSRSFSFTIIDNRLFEDAALTRGLKYTLFCLLRVAYQRHDVRISLRTLAKLIGIDERNVHEHLDKLETAGFLVRTISTGGGEPNTYDLTIDEHYAGQGGDDASIIPPDQGGMMPASSPVGCQHHPGSDASIIPLKEDLKEDSKKGGPSKEAPPQAAPAEPTPDSRFPAAKDPTGNINAVWQMLLRRDSLSEFQREAGIAVYIWAAGLWSSLMHTRLVVEDFAEQWEALAERGIAAADARTALKDADKRGTAAQIWHRIKAAFAALQPPVQPPQARRPGEQPMTHELTDAERRVEDDNAVAARAAICTAILDRRSEYETTPDGRAAIAYAEKGEALNAGIFAARHSKLRSVPST